jgi:type IV secretion system protein TrbI
MSDPQTKPEGAKVAPQTLSLRAQPRRTVRFKRNLLIAIAAIGCVAIVAIAWVALKGPALHPQTAGNQPLSTDHKPPPDGLDRLPSAYGQAKPVLGPPLPGDLGPPILEREKQLGVAPSVTPAPAENADAPRLAEQAKQLETASLFFQTGHGGADTVETAKAASPPSAPDQVTTAAASAHPGVASDQDPGGQQHKLDFLAQGVGETTDRHSLQPLASPYTVMAGSVISVSLLTGLDSDLPGLVTAQVTEPVYDTVSGRTLLIPQGSRLIGQYDSVVAWGQSRALLVWQRIVLPNGSSIQIDNVPASDPAGYSGLKDKVDFHTWTLLKGVAMSTLLGVGGQATFGSDQSNLVEAIRESTMESTNQAGQRIVEKDLNIQPTITVRPGWSLRVVLHKDLVLKPYAA